MQATQCLYRPVDDGSISGFIEVIVVSVGSKTLFIEHRYFFDRRDSHYGDTGEEYALLHRDNGKEPPQLLEGRKLLSVSPRVVRLILKSSSKAIVRQGSYDCPLDAEPWRESTEGCIGGVVGYA